MRTRIVVLLTEPVAEVSNGAPRNNSRYRASAKLRDAIYLEGNIGDVVASGTCWPRRERGLENSRKGGGVSLRSRKGQRRGSVAWLFSRLPSL